MNYVVENKYHFMKSKVEMIPSGFNDEIVAIFDKLLKNKDVKPKLNMKRFQSLLL